MIYLLLKILLGFNDIKLLPWHLIMFIASGTNVSVALGFYFYYCQILQTVNLFKYIPNCIWCPKRLLRSKISFQWQTPIYFKLVFIDSFKRAILISGPLGSSPSSSLHRSSRLQYNRSGPRSHPITRSEFSLAKSVKFIPLDKPIS